MPERPSFEERGERRVVVTGMGAITPIGNDVASFWDSLVAGRSGIRRIDRFDPARVPSKIAGDIRDFDASAVMDRKEIRRNDRYIHYAWAATVEAMRDAGVELPLTDEDLAERTGAIIGSGIGGINTMIRDIIEAHDYGPERVGPFLVTAMIINMGPGFVAIQSGARGPNYGTVSACASSNHAIGDALNIIRRGDADVMIAGGAEAGIGEIPVAAFTANRAQSTHRNDDPEKASRTIESDRDGFVMGDGAGIIVIEALEHAQARGAAIHAELVGYAATDDASHITLPAPNR
jgi:3-oxoacyl-[acyl-carrier-protein] synthase II